MTISELIRLANKQEAATNVIEERALKQLDRISKKLIREIEKKVLRQLELDDNGKVKRNTKNRALMARLKKILASVDFTSIERTFQNGINTVVNSTANYFKAFVKASDDLEYMRQQAIFKLMKQPFNPAVNKNFRQDILDKISKGIGFKELIKTLPSPTSAAKQLVFDSLHQRERIITKDMGDYIKLSHYLYTGGIIDNSREFCRERNRKVFTKKEVLNWSNLTWQGKSTPYSPFVDCGGFRCRHRLMPISKEMYDRYKNRLIP